MLGKIIDNVTGYLQAKLDVVKLTVIERTALVMGYFMFLLAGMMALTAILIFLGFGLSILFGDLCGSAAGGYFITAGLYTLIVVIIALQKKSLFNWMAGLFINMLTGDEGNEDKGKKESGNG